jgi:predicted mannosyl-3-phosphoglycerate phosphatase (HAD superfamily)
MDLDKLSEQFLVSEEPSRDRLGGLIQRLLPHCVVRKNGTVDITHSDRPGKELVKLVLSARLVASKLKGSSVISEVTAEEISEYTGLPKNQAAARAKESVDDKFAERVGRGSYRARLQKVEQFVQGITEIA